MRKITRYFMIALAAALIGWSCNKTETPPEPTPEPEPPLITYNIDIAATNSLGTYYEVEEGLTNYLMVLADIKIEGPADAPIPTGAGNLVVLEIFAKQIEEGILPVGTYNFTSGVPKEFQFSSTSKHLKTGVDNPVEEMNYFTEAQMIVAKEGDVYTIELIGKVGDQAQQRTIRTKYKGQLKFDTYGSGGNDDFFPRLDKNIETTFRQSQVSYYGKNQKNGHRFQIVLKDYETVTWNPIVGRILRIELFTATAENKMPAPGTYTIAATYAELSTYGPGQIQPGYIDNASMQNKGTHLIDTRDDQGRLKDYYGVASKGTVVISQQGDQTTFTINFTDENQYTIKGSYTGKINVRDLSYLTTLTGDHEIQLTGMPCQINFHEQLYAGNGINANSWVVQITSGETGSDALQLELLAPPSDFDKGLPAGTYILSDYYYDDAYTAFPGRIRDDVLLCSWYLGDMQGSNANIIAPLKTGEIVVTRSGNQCTITIDAADDFPIANKVTGTWIGTPTYTNVKASAHIPTFRTALKSK